MVIKVRRWASVEHEHLQIQSDGIFVRIDVRDSIDRGHLLKVIGKVLEGSSAEYPIHPPPPPLPTSEDQLRPGALEPIEKGLWPFLKRRPKRA